MDEDIHGFTMKGKDGTYNIYLNTQETQAGQLAAFLYEITHIYRKDQEKAAQGARVGEIEAETQRALIDALEIIRGQ